MPPPSSATLATNETTAWPDSPTIEDTERPLPDYVCCAVTEAVWTWFGAFVLIIVLFTVATLKYCKRTLRKPKYADKGHDLHLRYVLADDKGSLSLINMEPINTDEFHDYYLKRRRHRTVDGMEFRKLVQQAKSFPITMAEEEENIDKNHGHVAFPFDYNRVCLKPSDKAASDYINASLVKDFEDKPAWIVTQGPKDEAAIQDFWQLVWQKNTSLVVMLTRTFELIEILCQQYWPLYCDKPEDHGPFRITTLFEESFAHFKVRSVTVQREDECRLIKMFHYMEWTTHTDPPPYSILQFRRRFMEEQETSKTRNPDDIPIVHCHDGGTRTGSFLAIMECLAMADIHGRVDVFGTAQRLLEQRRALISSASQLTYIYDVIEDYVLCGTTVIPIGDLLTRLQAKSKKSGKDHLNDYQREHKLLDSLIPRFTIGDCAAGHRAENQGKNRNVLIVPPDRNRPYLKGDYHGGDYINAVFVDGFRKPDEFICTEWPMRNTLGNFWSMIYDHDIKTVVVLNHMNRGIGSTYPSFWPRTKKNRTKSYGKLFHVEMVQTTHLERKFSIWDLKLVKSNVSPHKRIEGLSQREMEEVNTLLKFMRSPEKKLRIFQIQCWPENQRVPNSTFALVELIAEVDKWRGHIESHSLPDDRVLVVSNDGCSRIGIYCVAAASYEQIYHRKEVDVFGTVKAVRKNRPQMIANVTEYKYVFDVVLHYVLNYFKEDENVDNEPVPAIQHNYNRKFSLSEQ